MHPDQRRQFDRMLEQVVTDLPDVVHDLMDEVPLVVEDYPPTKVLDDFGLAPRDALCGLHHGIPLTKRSVNDSGTFPETVTIYREGIWSLSTRGRRLDPEELRKQIRITILHEYGHHFGLDEDDLEELGYG